MGSQITRYVAAATLARVATGGSPLAVILMARYYDASGHTLGLLTACLTLPHLFGPFYGKWLEHSKAPCRLIACMAWVLALFFTFSVIAISYNSMYLCGLFLLVCGSSNAFLMGGLSTQLKHLVSQEPPARRKAFGFDAISYAIGMTLGPLLISAIAASYSPTIASLGLMCFPLLASVFIATLSPSQSKQSYSNTSAPPTMSDIIHTILKSAPLKKTLITTASTSFALSTLPVIAVYLGEHMVNDKQSGAYLVASYGAGNLISALYSILKPLQKNALTLMRNFAMGIALCLLGIALSNSYSIALFGFLLAGMVNALFFTSTLAARTEYAPERGASQVYMWVSTIKMAFASLGTLIAGFTVETSTNLPLFVSIGVIGMAIIIGARQGKST
ncbi:MFS transporter [Alteromonas sp. 5E99-2]|uniref:MFS transporter n=1 Tax=Alteromonas sp. 5E99-2 TaxID=2817683 RepID=UPI001A9912E9|nr:MFS transporter [Alteromonas sp. 5E99-2]MBO1256486.1 MFS transporter [Alteromonas sp. 5E99-2]